MRAFDDTMHTGCKQASVLAGETNDLNILVWKGNVGMPTARLGWLVARSRVIGSAPGSGAVLKKRLEGL